MKTIEERARIIAQKIIDYVCGRIVGEPNFVTNRLIEIATEQKAIDIDKVTKWMENDIAHRHELSYWVLEELPMRLKKAMEE